MLNLQHCHTIGGFSTISVTVLTHSLLSGNVTEVSPDRPRPCTKTWPSVRVGKRLAYANCMPAKVTRTQTGCLRFFKPKLPLGSYTIMISEKTNKDNLVRDSSVGITTGYGLDGVVLESRQQQDILCCPEPFWGPASLLFNRYRGSYTGHM